MTGLDLLGAVPAVQPPAKPKIRPLSWPANVIARPLSWPANVIAVTAGVLGAVVWRKHPVLGFLGFSAIASNAHAVVTRDRTWKEAVERVGRHVVATAGSLALPAHPAIGYIAAAVAADLLLDGEGRGPIEEWAHHVRQIPATPDGEVIDAEIVKDVQTKALVNHGRK